MAFTYRELTVWQQSKDLCITLIRALEGCKNYSFVNQLSRSVLSVPSNIAEGFERKGQAEFVQFLYVAKGSCSEMLTQIEIGIELGYIQKDSGVEFFQQGENIRKMLMSLISKELQSGSRK